MTYRIEKDALGEKQLPNTAYYGIHTARALDNFALHYKPVNSHLLMALVLIKKAAAMTNGSLNTLPSHKVTHIIKACHLLLEGGYSDQFVVDALQGGAGTSTNMNVNEVIANLGIESMGGKKGDYHLLHPLNDVNQSQSTNDVYPTALRIAAIRLLRKVSDAFAELQTLLQDKEQAFSHILKLGRTELMDGLPMMVGQGFGAYAQCIARDRWRLYKVEERLRQINIGGTALGTGLNATPKYIYMMTDTLQELTGLGLARSEFPMDITQNTDVFVEVSGLLKASAVNLMKIANDFRLLNSGPLGGLGEITLPSVQAGSSIMPGKVNPVMAEMMVQVAMQIMSNDQAITLACSQGQLELNAFYPLIADKLLESLELLLRAVPLFSDKCVKEIKVNERRCSDHLNHSTALVTALVHHIGYDACSDLAKKALEENRTIQEVAIESSGLTQEQLKEIFNPFQLTKPGIPGK